MRGKYLHWHLVEVVLCPTDYIFIHARIYYRGAATFTPYVTHHTERCAASTCCTNSWIRRPVCHTCRQNPLLNTDRLKYIQQVVEVLLYYEIATNNTTLVSLGDIAAEQSRTTLTMIEIMNQPLDYLAPNPHATIQYYASGIILFIHSDAS